MKLYVCWNTIDGIGGIHPCGTAYSALREAGYDPEVIKVRATRFLPSALTTDGRREVEQLTGDRKVPVLVTDDGEAINESSRIAEWAERNPASS